MPLLLPPLFYQPRGALDPAAGGLDPDTTAWINEVVADGGAVSGTQQTRVNDLIVALKGHSLFTTIDRLWLLGGESDASQAKIDIVNLGTNTVNGTIALAAAGYLSDGTTGFLHSNFTPSTAGGNYAQNSASLGAYAQTNPADSGVPIGASTGASFYYIQQAATFATELNAATFPAISITTNGNWTSSRVASTQFVAYRNGAAQATLTSTSVGLGAQPIYICADNNNGTASNFCNARISAGWIAGGWDATQNANFHTDLQAYMTAWGINV